MAASDAGNADIVRELERLETKLAEAERASASIKTVSRALTVILVIVIVALVYMLLNPLVSLARNPEPLQRELATALEERIVPQLEEEGKAFANEIVPEIQLIAKNVTDERRAEILATIETEYTLLFTNLQDQVSEHLVEYSQDMAQEQYDRLVAEFPEIERLDSYTDPSRPDTTKANLIIGSLDAVAQRLAQEFFDSHFQGLARLELEFDQFVVPDEVTRMSDKELQDYASRLAVEYFAERLDKALDEGTLNEL